MVVARLRVPLLVPLPLALWPFLSWTLALQSDVLQPSARPVVNLSLEHMLNGFDTRFIDVKYAAGATAFITVMYLTYSKFGYSPSFRN